MGISIDLSLTWASKRVAWVPQGWSHGQRMGVGGCEESLWQGSWRLGCAGRRSGVQGTGRGAGRGVGEELGYSPGERGDRGGGGKVGQARGFDCHTPSMWSRLFVLGQLQVSWKGQAGPSLWGGPPGGTGAPLCCSVCSPPGSCDARRRLQPPRCLTGFSMET